MPIYRPALRFKEGEYLALASLPEDMKREVIPYFVIPPLAERDPEKRRAIRSDEIAYITGERIGRYWPLQSAYVDLRFVLPELSAKDVARVFAQAASKNDDLIPVIPAVDFEGFPWKEVIRNESPKAAIYIPHSELDYDLLNNVLASIRLSASECELFVDFSSEELSPEIATDSVIATVEDLAIQQPWACIIFQASNFPIKNPADPDNECLIPRYEWEIYKQLLAAADVPRERLGFSDYGPDTGTIVFPTKSGGGMPIRHLRYSTTNGTLVMRGKKEGNQSDEIRRILKKLISRSEFFGADYSIADREMFDAATGRSGVGNATTWRRWNMGHHFALVLREYGKFIGRKFAPVVISEHHDQIQLL